MGRYIQDRYLADIKIDRYLTGWVNVCIDILNRQIKREIDRQIDRYTIYDIYIDYVDRYTRIFMQIMQGIYVDYVDRYTRIFMQIDMLEYSFRLCKQIDYQKQYI